VPNGPVRIGRALDNEVVIADSRVSRYHAQIDRDDYGPIVRDLGSTNGMSVSGRTVAEDRLGDGDLLLLGGYRIEVRLRAPAGRSGQR
jgi:pSer/pThr/pTyr-binding forkhead associated (FHA) protein